MLRLWILSLMTCLIREFTLIVPCGVFPSGGLRLRDFEVHLRSSKITTFFLITWPSKRRRSVRLSLLTSVPKTRRADFDCPPPYLLLAGGSYTYIPLLVAPRTIGDFFLSLKSSCSLVLTTWRFLKEGSGSCRLWVFRWIRGLLEGVSDEEDGLLTNCSILKFKLLTMAAEALEELPLWLGSSAKVWAFSRWMSDALLFFGSCLGKDIGSCMGVRRGDG